MGLMLHVAGAAAFGRRLLSMFHATDDLRIAQLKPLIPPAILMDELPITERASEVVSTARQAAQRILAGEDRRLLVVVGPCSIHDQQAAIEYAGRLSELSHRLQEQLQVVMRVYFEKPRTITGWKGLINDPFIDGSFQINKGLRIARHLLLSCAELGLPSGCEFLDTITPQYIADLVSWGAIGARTTESQVHRELASGMSMPIGFKNGTDGDVQIAIDAVRAAGKPHHFLSVTKQGLSAIFSTAGNPDCHVILRGGAADTNFSTEAIAEASQRLAEVDQRSVVMVDCSHGNSRKDHGQQPVVARSLARHLREGGREQVFGVMIESFLQAGRQHAESGRKLAYGQSITDACIDWDTTERVLEGLATSLS